MKKHTNKNAVVTGGNSGIGLAIARELISEGAEVIITARNKTAVEDIAKEIGATGIVSDQSILSDIDALVERTTAQFGTIDILVINAVCIRSYLSNPSANTFTIR